MCRRTEKGAWRMEERMEDEEVKRVERLWNISYRIKIGQEV
jgi:hypothetical protein